MRWYLALLALLLGAMLLASAGAQTLDGRDVSHPVCGDGMTAILVGDGWECTHGEDTTPPRVEPMAPFTIAARAGTCAPVTPPLYEIVYVRSDNQPSRYADMIGQFQDWAEGAGFIFAAGSEETGGNATGIKFLRDPGCGVVVTEAVIPAGSIGAFGPSINAIRALGYDKSDRNYLMFVDSGAYCGIGTLRRDESALGNRSAQGGSYARVDVPCWGAATAAHEIVHNLGGVQEGAPNSTAAGHCTDEWDLMCYADGGGEPMRSVCPDRERDAALDCNHDDYFNANPEPNTYLARAWNVARSPFLATRVVATATAQPTATPTMTPTATPTAKPAPTSACKKIINKRGRMKWKCQ